MITTRKLQLQDCEVISKAFQEQGWNKPQELYNLYFKEQRAGTREVLLAEYQGEFAGYVTVVWESSYPYFKENLIPEIKDFNVLIKHRRKRIGTVLMDEAERLIKQRSKLAGLLVGLLPGYGPAQIMYVNRGYKPDGHGISYGYSQLHYGDEVRVDDDLALALVKKVE